MRCTKLYSATILLMRPVEDHTSKEIVDEEVMSFCLMKLGSRVPPSYWNALSYFVELEEMNSYLVKTKVCQIM